MKTASQASPQTPVALTPHQFLKATKPQRQNLTFNLPSNNIENQTLRVQLPQAGLLNQLYVKLEFDVTIADTTNTAGVWATLPTPAPFGVITSASFFNNNNYRIRDLDGWTWYTWVRNRYGFDVLSADPGISFATDVAARLGNNLGSSTAVPGARVAAGTYHFSIALPMPIAYNRSGDTGLIVLPTPGVYYYLELQIGSIVSGITATGGTTNLITGLVGTGITATLSNVSLKASMEYFVIPAGSAGRLKNFVSMFMAVSKQVFPTLNPGLNVNIPPPNDFYTTVMLELINNGAHLAGQNVTNIQWKYGGQIIDYIDDLDMMFVQTAWNTKQIPMDGQIVWDLGYRMGNLLKRDSYDAFNAQQVTGLQFEYTIPGNTTITAPSQITAVYESLRPIGQPY